MLVRQGSKPAGASTFSAGAAVNRPSIHARIPGRPLTAARVAAARWVELSSGSDETPETHSQNTGRGSNNSGTRQRWDWNSYTPAVAQPEQEEEESKTQQQELEHAHASNGNGTYNSWAPSHTTQHQDTHQLQADDPPYSLNGHSAPDLDEEVVEVVEEAANASQGLFNDTFKNVLAEALTRKGPNSLLEQAQPEPKNPLAVSDQEEVLHAGIISSRQTLLRLKMIRNETEKAIEAELRQLERLNFALEKARNDAAYYGVLDQMYLDGRTSD